MDFKSYAKISELGYEEAKRVFEQHGLCGTFSNEEELGDAANSMSSVEAITGTLDHSSATI